VRDRVLTNFLRAQNIYGILTFKRAARSFRSIFFLLACSSSIRSISAFTSFRLRASLMSGSGIAPSPASGVVEGTVSADEDDDDDDVEPAEGPVLKPSMDPSNEKLATSLMLAMAISSSLVTFSFESSTNLSTTSLVSITGDDDVLLTIGFVGGCVDEYVVVVETGVVCSLSAVDESFRLRRLFFFPSLLPDVNASLMGCRSKG
jgi:hypothetical protein